MASVVSRGRALKAGAGGSGLLTLWTLYANYTTAMQLPADLRRALKVLESAPPWWVFVPFVLLLIYGLWPERWKRRPEQLTPTEEYEAAIRKASATGLTSPDGTQRFFPATITQDPPPRKGNRDTTLAEALGQAIHGEWGKPHHLSGSPFTWALGGNDPRKLLAKVTSLAAEGCLTIWGKRDDPGYFEEIPRSYWEENDLTIADMLGGVVAGGDDPYRGLMLSRAQVERVWPHEG